MNWWGMRRRLHISWWIAIVSFAFVAGVCCAKVTPHTVFSSYVWHIVAILGCGFVFWKRYIYLVPLIIAVGVIMGLWRGALQIDGLSDLKKRIGSEQTITGHVPEDTDLNAAQETIMHLDQLQIDKRDIKGVIWVNAKTTVVIKRGDQVTIKGVLSEGFGSFSASVYRASIIKVERPQPGDVARQARDWFSSKVETGIPSPESSLGLGFLVGQKSALPADLIEALRVVGLTHIVVASGYNLTILVRLARRLFEKISKYLSALSAAIMILFFLAVTGASPSMSRAGLVAGLSLAAWYFGRKFHPVVLLGFVAGVTVLVNPSYVWGDLGWELSFAAFAGVMILAPLLQRYFFGDKKPGMIRQVFGETIAAIIVTAPLIMYTFGQFSNVALITNVLVVPLVPLAMLLTSIAGIGAVLVPGVATIIGAPATWLLQYMVGVSQYFAAQPWAVSMVHLSLIVVVAMYLSIIGVCFWLKHATQFDLRNTNIIE